MSQEEFTSSWLSEHTPLTAKTHRVVQYRCYPIIGFEGPEPLYEAAAVLSFVDKGAYDLAMVSPEFAAALADAPNLQMTEETLGFIAGEHVIRGQGSGVRGDCSHPSSSRQRHGLPCPRVQQAHFWAAPPSHGPCRTTGYQIQRCCNDGRTNWPARHHLPGLCWSTSAWTACEAPRCRRRSASAGQARASP
jgi:uncharacterized protein (TIGR02118 family)